MNLTQRASFGALALLFLTAGDFTKAMRECKQAEKAEKSFEAAVACLEAVEEKPDHKKAREDAMRLVQPGYEEHVALAAELEGNAVHGAAWRTYGDVKRMLATLQRVGIDLGVEPIDVDARILETGTRAAEVEYAKADAAIAAGKWKDGIASFEDALHYIEDFRDTKGRIERAYLGWGDEELGRSAWRDAVARYESALKWGAETPAKQRAAEVMYALAQHFLAGGHCRQAVYDARKAKALQETPAVSKVLGDAMRCAVRPVKISLTGEPSGGNTAGVAVGALLRSVVQRSLAAQVSEFVPIVDPSTGQTAAGLPPAYVVELSVTVANVTVDEPDVSTVRDTAVTLKTCTKIRNGEPYTTTCEEDVDVVYEVYQRSASARVDVVAKAITVGSNRVVWTTELGGTASDAIRYGSNLRFPNGVEARLTSTGEDGSVKSYAVSELYDARRVLTTPDAMIRSAVERAAADATAKVIASFDTVAAPPDPATLKLTAL